MPTALRRKYGLDRPGAQVEIVERDDGVIELRPHMAVPASQAWFWEDQWQRREREVDEHVVAGNVTVHSGAGEFLDHLDRLDADGPGQSG